MYTPIYFMKLSSHIKHLDEQLGKIEHSTAIEDDVAVINGFGIPSGRGAEQHAGDANRKRMYWIIHAY